MHPELHQLLRKATVMYQVLGGAVAPRPKRSRHAPTLSDRAEAIALQAVDLDEVRCGRAAGCV